MHSEEATKNSMERKMAGYGIPKRYAAARLVGGGKDGFDPTQSYYIHGITGSGKTHMMSAMVAEQVLGYGNRGVTSIHMYNADELLMRLREEIGKNKEPDLSIYDTEEDARKDVLITRLMEMPILAIDDIGAERPTEWVMSQLYLIINTRYNEMLPTYFTSNFDLDNLAQNLNQRIASRIRGMCKAIALPGIDRRGVN